MYVAEIVPSAESALEAFISKDIPEDKNGNETSTTYVPQNIIMKFETGT